MAGKSQKEVIIQVAVQLFKEKGYAATSMQDVAKNLDCTKAAIYYYFESKEDILLTIINETMQIAEEKIEHVISQDLNPPQMLKAIIKDHIYAVFEKKSFITVFFFDKNNLSSENLELIHQRRRKYEEKIAQVIKRGMDEGYFAKTEVLPVVYGILGMCNWMVQWYKPEGKFEPDEIAEIYWDIAYKGLKNK